ncbi:MAG: glycosyltransferase family 4 protein [Acidimicrobiia bacterium]|nr:glycosyltransferase family 4 protein [Acidimicrobiia bacterium]
MVLPKLLHVVGDSKYGGGSLIVLELAKAAVANGFDVSVLATDAEFVRRLEQAGIRAVESDCVRREIRPLWDLRGLRRLRRLIEDGGYSIVQTHTSKGGVIGRLAAWKADVPVVIHTVHGFAVHDRSSSNAIRATAAIEKWAGRKCHRIVTVSESHCRWAIELGIAPPDKLVAIPNGIDASRVIPSRPRSEVRAEFGVGADEVILLSTGRLAKQKGLEDLLRAVPLLRNQHSVPAHVILAGDGPSRADLESLVSSQGLGRHVSFLGFRTDLGDLLAAADLFVAPSIYEGLSISLLEAMAAAKPIVTTDIPSNLEVTDHGRVARLVSPADPIDLAVAIAELATDHATAQQMGAAARSRLEAHYTRDVMTSAYIELYRALLAA